MKQTSYLTTTIQAGNRLEINLPNFPIGQTVEVIIITETPNPDAQTLVDVSAASALAEASPLVNRSAFLKLPIGDRRRILEQQAEAALPHYQEDTEWQEWVNLDMAEIHA